MLMRKYILQSAIDANRKRCGCSNYYHMCVAFRGGKILAYGYNCCCESTTRYGHADSLHAEINMLKKLGKTTKSFDILVIRLNKAGDMLLDSQPCRRCENWIKNYPVNKIYFSTKTGKIKYMFRKEIPKLFKMKKKYRIVNAVETNISLHCM